MTRKREIRLQARPDRCVRLRSRTSFTRSTDHFQGTRKGAGRSVGQTGWTRHCHSLPAEQHPTPILTAVRRVVAGVGLGCGGERAS
jgi:hypothetical protein